MRCEFEMADDHDHDLGARMAGASRMVNAIPAVCEARPGLLSALDLPLVTGAGLVRSVPGPSPDSRLL
jgi:4-hydroxy-tetrahydrodipicolinate reductase